MDETITDKLWYKVSDLVFLYDNANIIYIFLKKKPIQR